MGDTTTANNKRKEKRPRDVCRVGRTEFFRSERSHGLHLSQVPTHTRGPEPCPSWTASPPVTSLQRRVEEKGEMWTPCFSVNNGVSQTGIFFRLCEGISVVNCKKIFFFFGGGRVELGKKMPYSYFFIVLNDTLLEIFFQKFL